MYWFPLQSRATHLETVWGRSDSVHFFHMPCSWGVDVTLFLKCGSKVSMSPSWQTVLLSFVSCGFCSTDGTEGMCRDYFIFPRSLWLAIGYFHNWRLCSAAFTHLNMNQQFSSQFCWSIIEVEQTIYSGSLFVVPIFANLLIW